jgi:hypothetical protein
METASKTKDDLWQAGRTLGENLAEGLNRAQETVQDRVRSGFEQTRGVFSTLDEEFGKFVREQPVVALGGAFLVGYLIARAARAFE